MQKRKTPTYSNTIIATLEHASICKVEVEKYGWGEILQSKHLFFQVAEAEKALTELEKTIRQVCSVVFVNKQQRYSSLFTRFGLVPAGAAATIPTTCYKHRRCVTCDNRSRQHPTNSRESREGT